MGVGKNVRKCGKKTIASFCFFKLFEFTFFVIISIKQKQTYHIITYLQSTNLSTFSSTETQGISGRHGLGY